MEFELILRNGLPVQRMRPESSSASNHTKMAPERTRLFRSISFKRLETGDKKPCRTASKTTWASWASRRCKRGWVACCIVWGLTVVRSDIYTWARLKNKIVSWLLDGKEVDVKMWLSSNSTKEPSRRFGNDAYGCDWIRKGDRTDLSVFPKLGNPNKTDEITTFKEIPSLQDLTPGRRQQTLRWR